MVFKVRGTTLPDREQRTLVIDGDRLHVDDASDAELISDGGWILPGLVDAHTHPGAVSHEDTFDHDKLRRHLTEHRDAGVLLVRTPGTVERMPDWVDEEPDLPRVQSAGRWLVTPGTFYPDYGREIGYDELVAAAVEESQASSGWCKVIGDWRPIDPAVPLDLLTEMVSAVHAIGGRVSVHAATAEGCHNAVLAGADSIEHGMHMDPSLLDRMAEQGTVLVPTLTAFAQAADHTRAQPQTVVRDWWLSGWEGLPLVARSAHEAGVTVLAGTDSAPFGNITQEIDWLLKAGLPTEVAIGAASWTARDWLGLPGDISEGGPADLVIYDEDPVVNPGVLAHPKRIILRGRIIV
ncbi:MAG TPA: amidohydrolase family protein [Pseudonocardiaceae bacterium]|jgi:imidazolonepropionase-like amidohydrolase|nr:amidohydrolase family protein [Pseudonocardiaceae bacterium]